METLFTAIVAIALIVMAVLTLSQSALSSVDSVGVSWREMESVAEERARQLQARRVEILAELAPLDGQRKVQVERVAQVQDEVEQLGRGLAERKQRLPLSLTAYS